MKSRVTLAAGSAPLASVPLLQGALSATAAGAGPPGPHTVKD